jgi:hypothetical protein
MRHPWTPRILLLALASCTDPGKTDDAAETRAGDASIPHPPPVKDSTDASQPTNLPDCDEGATRQCVGAGACAGGQYCADGEWSRCDCGEGDAPTDDVPPIEADDETGPAVVDSGVTVPPLPTSDTGTDSDLTTLPPGWREVPLLADESGWIQGSENEVGIQGGWTSLYAPCVRSTEVALRDPTDPGAGVCVRATWEPDCEQTPSMILGVHLSEDEPGNPSPNPYDAVAAGVVGFRFDINFEGTGLYGTDRTLLTAGVQDRNYSALRTQYRDFGNLPNAGISWVPEWVPGDVEFVDETEEPWSPTNLESLWFIAISGDTRAQQQLCVANLRAVVRSN